ncbi:uncharacterized protein HMPREF1541_05501 [Cyphellophora europaea CBS 101466]|uniref:Secreted protein n=1 Tax=Cyphellophora europaea (strain CBS 101466) TaxID=1220924 RepID=W2RU31_CYPE1|nr:uncharacterized protein HMPREF1541_05501 [Cyphellophora europaea CBS 101466]ETN39278.1 hypothetical protein HMPREF1541_05501 [Cyphellophora europaea CBS 101466]
MKLTSPTPTTFLSLFLLPLLSTPHTLALPTTSDPSPSTNTTLPLSSILDARALDHMNGKCKNDRCKVSTRSYPCQNSNCNGKGGQKCVVAPGETGAWVAKCPNNELPYEWEWPWKAPKV